MLLALGLLSGILGVVGIAPYIRDILLKKTKPERASWLIWMVLEGIAFFSQLAKGATNSLWLPGVETVAVAIVFILSIKYGEGGFTSRDIIALITAFCGLIVWFFTKEASFALFIVILIDAAGAYLTVIKAYKEPASETLITWVLSVISAILAAFAVGAFNFILLLYPIYLALGNFAVVAAILLGKRKTSK